MLHVPWLAGTIVLLCHNNSYVRITKIIQMDDSMNVKMFSIYYNTTLIYICIDSMKYDNTNYDGTNERKMAPTSHHTLPFFWAGQFYHTGLISGVALTIRHIANGETVLLVAKDIRGHLSINPQKKYERNLVKDLQWTVCRQCIIATKSYYSKHVFKGHSDERTPCDQGTLPPKC